MFGCMDVRMFTVGVHEFSVWLKAGCEKVFTVGGCESVRYDCHHHYC